MRFGLGRGLERPLRRILPRSLLGRSLLIIVIPLVASQAIALQLFYGSHLNIVSRRLSSAVAGEVMETLEQLERFPEQNDRDWIIASALRNYGLVMRFEPGRSLRYRHRHNILGPMDDDLEAAMKEVVARPFTMDWTSDPHEVLLRIQLDDGVLAVTAPRKRLDIGTIYLFMTWLVGSSALLFAIAALFMRIQVRAIRRLSRAAEGFGTGRNVGFIKPEGAQEVRRAATAFNLMQERILRFVTQRTEMLAGVSHDLRTPLTRLRLSLAFLPGQAKPDGLGRPDGAGKADGDAIAGEIDGMVGDIEEMERMIDGYLAFARGEGAERSSAIDLVALLEDIASAAGRAGADVRLARGLEASATIEVRPDAIRRAITNLVDNARRHATRVELSIQLQSRQVQILVDDDGPGVPPARRETVFRAFQSGSHGGTGLGLTIARDIVRAHGGDIMLEASPLGGLRARTRIPQ